MLRPRSIGLGVVTNLPGSDDVALVFVEPDRLLERRSGLLWAVSEAQDLAEVGKRLRAQVKTLPRTRRHWACPSASSGTVRRSARHRSVNCNASSSRPYLAWTWNTEADYGGCAN